MVWGKEYFFPLPVFETSPGQHLANHYTGCMWGNKETNIGLSFILTKSSLCVLILYIHFIDIYFSQHNCIIKTEVKATCFDLKSHRQAKLRTMKFFTIWLCAFGIPDGSQCVP